MIKRKDKWDKAVEYFTKHPEEIKDAWWVNMSTNEFKYLFEFMGRNGSQGACPTAIKNFPAIYSSGFRDLDEYITTLPFCGADATKRSIPILDDLPYIAQIQRMHEALLRLFHPEIKKVKVPT